MKILFIKKMGKINCCIDDRIKYEDDNKKLFQINRLKEKCLDKENNSTKDTEDFNADLEDNQNLNNGQYQLLSYDIEENTLFKYIIKIPIITSLNGLSELNLNSKLYVCGTPSK